MSCIEHKNTIEIADETACIPEEHDLCKFPVHFAILSEIVAVLFRPEITLSSVKLDWLDRVIADKVSEHGEASETEHSDIAINLFYWEIDQVIICSK